MLHLQEILAMQEGEHVVRVLRRSLWTTVPGLAISGFLIALPFFFLFPLTRMGFVGAVLLCAVLAYGIYLSLKCVLLWDSNVLVLTDRRFIVVRQGGLWSRQVIEAPLAGSQAAASKPSIFFSFLRMGNVTLSGHGLSGPVMMTGLSAPNSVARMILGLRDAQSAGFRVQGVS